MANRVEPGTSSPKLPPIYENNKTPSNYILNTPGSSTGAEMNWVKTFDLIVGPNSFSYSVDLSSLAARITALKNEHKVPIILAMVPGPETTLVPPDHETTSFFDVAIVQGLLEKSKTEIAAGNKSVMYLETSGEKTEQKFKSVDAIKEIFSINLVYFYEVYGEKGKPEYLGDNKEQTPLQELIISVVTEYSGFENSEANLNQRLLEICRLYFQKAQEANEPFIPSDQQTFSHYRKAFQWNSAAFVRKIIEALYYRAEYSLKGIGYAPSMERVKQAYTLLLQRLSPLKSDESTTYQDALKYRKKFALLALQLSADQCRFEDLKKYVEDSKKYLQQLAKNGDCEALSALGKYYLQQGDTDSELGQLFIGHDTLFATFLLQKVNDKETSDLCVEQLMMHGGGDQFDAILAEKQPDDYNPQVQFKIALFLCARGNVEEGVKYLASSALSYADAKFFYGLYLMQQPGSEESAVLNMEQAAEKKHASASFYLGLFYAQKGKHKKALEYFRAASAMGHPEATTNLAAAYYHGNGVDKDEQRALKLYQLAKNRDCDLASSIIKSNSLTSCDVHCYGLKGEQDKQAYEEFDRLLFWQPPEHSEESEKELPVETKPLLPRDDLKKNTASTPVWVLPALVSSLALGVILGYLSGRQQRSKDRIIWKVNENSKKVLDINGNLQVT